jgi:hypothetical protein
MCDGKAFAAPAAAEEVVNHVPVSWLRLTFVK